MLVTAVQNACSLACQGVMPAAPPRIVDLCPPHRRGLLNQARFVCAECASVFSGCGPRQSCLPSLGQQLLPSRGPAFSCCGTQITKLIFGVCRHNLHNISRNGRCSGFVCNEIPFLRAINSPILPLLPFPGPTTRRASPLCHHRWHESIYASRSSDQSGKRARDAWTRMHSAG